jgi:hypothetical protein
MCPRSNCAMKSLKASWRSFFWILDDTLQNRKMTSVATIQNLRLRVVPLMP